ncbi:MAG TPA: hypothetical protein VFH48_46280 [Chloroflexota bacterium]|nr:hypothetical protein [Chloroflexota bacterium]
MANQIPERGLKPDELAAEEAAELPDREAMSLLDLNLDLSLDADAAAPVGAAIAANANVAAPIDAAVAANVGSVDSTAIASADQDAQITQILDGVAIANADQEGSITQGSAGR